MRRWQATPRREPQRVGEVIADFLAGYQPMGLCRACWCRQDLADGARCLRCGGIVARVRVRVRP